MNTQSLKDNSHGEVQWEDVQGLLRTGYGQFEFSQFIRIEFFEETSEKTLKEWLSTLLAQGNVEHEGMHLPTINHADFLHINSPAEKQIHEQISTDSEIKINIGVSVSGLLRFGLPSTALSSFPLEFIDGMGSDRAAALLGDLGKNYYKHWSWGGTHSTPHIVLLVYSNSRAKMDALDGRLKLHSIGKVEVLNTHLSKFEHFGFHDGLSNPEIRRAHRSVDAPTRNPEGTLEPGEFIFGYPDQRSLYPVSPSTPLASDREDILPRAQPERTSADDVFPLDRKDFGHNGSFLVVRQLEQDVDEFKDYLDSHGRDNPGRLGAKMMGRWANGTATTLTALDTQPEPPNLSNQFHYQGVDSHGMRCPIGAHIRRANPRDGLLEDAKTSFDITNRHRILRRGRLYETPQSKGLLFICLNVSISRQFEHTQSNWINNSHLAHEYETDPMIGAREIGNRKFTIPNSPMNERVENLADFVTVKGGCYFFLPSLTALRFLCS